ARLSPIRGVVIAASVSALLAGPVFAQGAPPVAPIVERAAPLTTSPIERVLPTPQPHASPRLIAPPETPAETSEGGVRVVIGAVDVSGATVYRVEELAPYYADIVGKAVPQDRVAQVVREIQTRYRNDGYFLTVVHGAVDQANGVNSLHVRVIEGFISDVK